MTAPSQTESTATAWWDEVRAKYAHGESSWSLLHGGGVFDYADEPGYPVVRWIAAQFAGNAETPGREVIFNLSLDRGITFEQPWMHKIFTTTLGLVLDADPDMAAAQGDGSGEIPLPGGDKPDQMVEFALEFLKHARKVGRGDLSALARFSCHECGSPQKAFIGDANGSIDAVVEVMCMGCKNEWTIDEPLVEGGARSAAMIVEDADLLMPAVADDGTLTPERARLLKMLHRAPTDPKIARSWNPVVMLTPTLSGVHKRLRAKGCGLHPIKVPLPDFDARLRTIKMILAGRPDLKMEMTADQFAALTAGLYRRNIEDIVLAADDGVLTRDIALARQKEAMDAEYDKVLERLEPTFGYDAIYGYDELKHNVLTRVIEPMRSGDPNKLLWVSKGALISGPPGVAKTDFGMATAFEAGFNCIRIKNVKEKWVGSSEDNIELVIEGAEMFAPAIIIVDEADKAGFKRPSGDGNDHPVDASIRKRFQEWMSDPRIRGRIWFLFLTNFPEVIDEAIKRPGRLDVHAPMLLPDTAEWRGGILQTLLARNGHSEQDLQWLSKTFGTRTDKWSGADLGGAVTKACATVALTDMSLAEALEDAFATIRHSTTPATEAMATNALNDCNDTSLLPPKERAKLKAREEAAIEPREPVAAAAAPEPIRRGRRAGI